eukprot:CAMPEP_0197590880 /NCGR_PEP_ID=MMETSP1326-20131121/12272_1 /TAXON_ID=1155430 /ORGANISM="Genus nov. species nov., Strain RCC2288" /LENGTH=218 /DNA_ID=CAMNT_0043156175 /DNA_START=36 /DNA_END=692 /DNA_ORIENTATION=-
MILQYAEALCATRRLVLASASPRRREILANLGLKFDVVVSTFDENLDKAQFSGGADYAKATATHKALEVATRLETEDRAAPFMVIGADTVVEAPDGSIMEKPKDAAEAMKMLLSLQGITHQVHTGVGVVFPNTSGGPLVVHSFSETTRVTFAPLEEAEMLAYIKTGEPFDKAGGYGIQGPAGAFVSSITGCYFNVMGFPVHRFTSKISDMIRDGTIKL